MEEYQSIMKNDVWDVVPRPEGKFVVTSKWIYKIKHLEEGIIKKYPTIHTNTIGQHTIGQNAKTHETVGHNLTSHRLSGVSIMVVDEITYLLNVEEGK